MISARDLQTTFVIFYDNNPQAYNSVFRNAGYNVPSDMAQARKYVIRKMYDMYFNSPAQLKQLMDAVTWNTSANNYTTQTDVQRKIWDYLRTNIPADGTSQPKADQPLVGKFNWDNLQGWLFGNQSSVITNTVTTPPSAMPAIIGFSVLGIAVVFMVIFSIRMFK